MEEIEEVEIVQMEVMLVEAEIVEMKMDQMVEIMEMLIEMVKERW